MRSFAFSVLALSWLGFSGCGGEDTAAPGFPRSFTSVSTSCSMTYSIHVASDLGAYVEEVQVLTEEASTEPLFPEQICLFFTNVIDFTGEVQGKHVDHIPCPDPEASNWSLILTVGPGDWYVTGTGTGYGHIMELEMEPLFDECDPPCQCGYRTTGTIR